MSKIGRLTCQKLDKNCLKLFEIILNCLKLSKIVQIALSCQKLSDFVQTCLMVANVKGYILLSTKNCPKWSEIVKTFFKNGLNVSSDIKFSNGDL